MAWQDPSEASPAAGRVGSPARGCGRPSPGLRGCGPQGRLLSTHCLPHTPTAPWDTRQAARMASKTWSSDSWFCCTNLVNWTTALSRPWRCPPGGLLPAAVWGGPEPPVPPGGSHSRPPPAAPAGPAQLLGQLAERLLPALRLPLQAALCLQPHAPRGLHPLRGDALSAGIPRDPGPASGPGTHLLPGQGALLQEAAQLGLLLQEAQAHLLAELGHLDRRGRWCPCGRRGPGFPTGCPLPCVHPCTVHPRPPQGLRVAFLPNHPYQRGPWVLCTLWSPSLAGCTRLRRQARLLGPYGPEKARLRGCEGPAGQAHLGPEYAWCDHW